MRIFTSLSNTLMVNLITLLYVYVDKCMHNSEKVTGVELVMT